MPAAKPEPLAIVTSSVSDFLLYVLKHSATRYRAYKSTPSAVSSPHILEKDTIIVCCTRDIFIREILQDIRVPIPQLPNRDPHGPSHSDINAEAAEDDNNDHKHLLLSSPISLLQTASNINIVYTSTIHHLRAYVSTLKPPSSSNNFSDISPPILAVHCILPMHYSSTEFSLQGLSRTFALLMSSTSSRSSRYRLLISVPQSELCGLDAEIPLMNSIMMKNNASRKKSYYGGEGFEEGAGEERDMRFIGRVRSCIQRWCRIVEMDELLRNEAEVEGGEEDGERMLV